MIGRESGSSTGVLLQPVTRHPLRSQPFNDIHIARTPLLYTVGRQCQQPAVQYVIGEKMHWVPQLPRRTCLFGCLSVIIILRLVCRYMHIRNPFISVGEITHSPMQKMHAFDRFAAILLGRRYPDVCRTVEDQLK